MRNIPFERQKTVSLDYKGILIGEYRLDFLVDNKIIVELKSVDSFSSVHTAQLLAYLKATNLKVGLFINFNVASLKNGIRRIVSKQPLEELLLEQNKNNSGEC